MVKPGVFSVDKKQVNLKQGDATVEYVHVEVKPVQTKPETSTRGKGCTLKRLIGIFLAIAVLTGIAVSVAYAVNWEEESEPHMPEGGDVIYPENPGNHDGHHGEYPGDHDGHHGHPGDHDDHPGDHDDHPSHPHHGEPSDGENDGRPEPTERPPPIDYIGTRTPQHPTQPTRPRTRRPHHPTRPPRTRLPHHPGTRPTREPTRHPGTRPPHEPTRSTHHPHRPPHHPPHHSPHHPPHHPPYGEPYYPGLPSERPQPLRDYTRSTAPPLFGRPDGHEYHDAGFELSEDTPGDIPGYYDRLNGEPLENNREDFDHPKMKHRDRYKGLSAWKADHAVSQRRITEERMREMTRQRPQEAGRSRVEIEEERHGYDYGHSTNRHHKI